MSVGRDVCSAPKDSAEAKVGLAIFGRRCGRLPVPIHVRATSPLATDVIAEIEANTPGEWLIPRSARKIPGAEKSSAPD
jgi:hypothetical protein